MNDRVMNDRVMNDRDFAEIAALPALAQPAPPPLPAALEAELSSLAPASARRPVRQLALLLGISSIYLAGIFAMMTRRPDLGELPRVWVVGMCVAWLVGFVVPMYLAMVPRPGAVLPRYRLAGLAALVGAVAFVALGLAIHPSGPHSATDIALARSYGCLEVGVAVALLPILVGTILLRRTLPVGSRPVAAALGAGGGALAGLLLHLHCHVTDALHIGLMHGGVVGVAALLAAALVPRVTELR